MTEREQGTCYKRHEDELKANDNGRRGFDGISAMHLQDWRLTCEDALWKKIENIPGFYAAWAGNDLEVVHQAITRTALGEGAASMCREFLDIFHMTMDDQNYSEYLNEYPKAVTRFMDRGDP